MTFIGQYYVVINLIVGIKKQKIPPLLITTTHKNLSK